MRLIQKKNIKAETNKSAEVTRGHVGSNIPGATFFMKSKVFQTEATETVFIEKSQ